MAGLISCSSAEADSFVPSEFTCWPHVRGSLTKFGFRLVGGLGFRAYPPHPLTIVTTLEDCK